MSLDRTDIGAIITAMYAMISGPAGARDWSLQEIVFHPEARMIRTGADEAGRTTHKIMSLAGYREATAPFFASSGFFEIETARKLDIFGNIAHAWSAYEARLSLDDIAPERRGINSIQLMRDENGHWRIMAMIWDNEREGVRLPRF
jgi:hypothetical protein